MSIRSVDKGKRAERAVVNYLREHGFATARRVVRTGTAIELDEGDIRIPGVPVTFEVKHYAGGLTRQEISRFLRKLVDEQCRPGDLGILVERGHRVSDPGQWTAWLTLSDVEALLGADTRMCRQDAVAMGLGCLVRLLNQWVRGDRASDYVQAVSEPIRARNPYLSEA